MNATFSGKIRHLRMDAPPTLAPLPPLHPLHPLHIPDLPPDRLRRWCEQRTRLDVGRAARKGKILSDANMRRMLARRYAAAMSRDLARP